MQRDDIEQVVALEQTLFSNPWHRLSYEDEITRKDAYCLVVRAINDNLKHPIVAYSLFRLFEDEMHLFKIAVDKKWQQKGIASQLLSKCLEIAVQKGATIAYLEVRVSNISAISLYKKYGFRVVGKRHKYYADTKEDALIMLNNIKQEATS